jgi:hypothetical protein
MRTRPPAPHEAAGSSAGQFQTWRHPLANGDVVIVTVGPNGYRRYDTEFATAR